MTVKEVQELVGAWNEKHATRNSELTSMALLTDKVGELARAIAHKHDNPAAGHHGTVPLLSDEIADILWELTSLSDVAGVDLTEALIRNLEKRNK